MTELTTFPAINFPGVQPVSLKRHKDIRGSLLPIEFHQLPFTPKRIFTVAGMTAGTVRGGHSHRWGQQLLICLRGQIDLLLRHDGRETNLSLMPDEQGLLIGSGVWHSQTYVAEDSVLLVLASEPYNPESYVYDVESQA